MFVMATELKMPRKAELFDESYSLEKLIILRNHSLANTNWFQRRTLSVESKNLNHKKNLSRMLKQ